MKFELCAECKTSGEYNDNFYISGYENEFTICMELERTYKIEDLVALQMLLDRFIKKVCLLDEAKD
jgi:hypothetical protein